MQPPKKPATTVIDLTEDSIEEIVEAYSTVNSHNDLAIWRTLFNNGLSEPLPLPPPLPISSSPIRPKTTSNSSTNNRASNTRNTRNLTASDEVTVVKTVKLPAGSKTKKPPVVVIPSDPPAVTVAERKCPVCFDLIQNPSVTLCGHVYCTECIKAAVSATKQCPICRRKMTAKGFHPLYL